VPPLTVKPGPRGLARVCPCASLRSAARSDEFQTATFASGGSACSGLDSEPPAARRGAGAGRHGLPPQTATTNERRPDMTTPHPEQQPDQPAAVTIEVHPTAVPADELPMSLIYDVTQVLPGPRPQRARDQRARPSADLAGPHRRRRRGLVRRAALLTTT
jgi:hypothetical protein